MSLSAFQPAMAQERAAGDTIRVPETVFEQQAQDPYLKRYGRMPGEGWIPLPKTTTEVRFSGFIQANYIHDFQNAGFPAGSFFPALIPVPTNETGQTTFDPRTSKFAFETRTNTADAGVIRTVFDMDLYGSLEGPFVGFRVRQAYVTWVGRRSNISFTAGRAFSTYVDLGAWPEIADLQGPNAMTGARAGLLRGSYAFGEEKDLVFDLSFEQPQTAVDGARGLTDMPDIAGRLNWQKGWGHLAVMGLVRRLVAQDSEGEGKDAALGNGLSLSGSLLVPGTERDATVEDNLGPRQDNLQFQIQSGSGTGRYVFDLGVATTPQDAIYDPAAQEVLPLSQWGGFAAYHHWWTDRLRSQLVYGFEQVDNRSLQDDAAYQKTIYALANLAYRPATRFDIALEYAYGRLTNKVDQTGHANRLMLALNYGF